MTTATKNLLLAMLAQAAECVVRDDYERAEGWCRGAWDLIDGGLEFVDTDDNEGERK